MSSGWSRIQRSETRSLPRALLFGPLLPARWRLVGHGARPEAEALFAAALADLGPAPRASAEQADMLRLVAEALGERALAEIAERLQAAGAGIAYAGG